MIGYDYSGSMNFYSHIEAKRFRDPRVQAIYDSLIGWKGPDREARARQRVARLDAALVTECFQLDQEVTA